MGFLSASELRDLRRDIAATFPSKGQVHRVAEGQDDGGEETREQLPVGKPFACRVTPFKSLDVIERGSQRAPEANYTVLCAFEADVRFSDTLHIDGHDYEVLGLDGRGEALCIEAMCLRRG